ncbi:MAG: glycosyltransferase family 4 protein [Ilumatobacter sp.]|nr:glycosyltransferase family 4 protein [Ilumatobacter sp.]
MTANKKLLLMTNSVAMGGMEEHVRLLAKEIDRSRFTVHTAVPDWPATEEFHRSMVTASDSVTLLAPDRRYGLVRQLRDAFGLWGLARRERFDAVHLHSTTYRGFSVAILALRSAGVRGIVMTEHLAPEAPVSAKSRRIRGLTTRLIRTLVCVSENNRQSRERYLGVAPCTTVVVDNGIDVDKFEPQPEPDELDALRSDLGIAPGAPVVGTAIRLEPDKGVDDLVDAFALLRPDHPDAVLLVVGDGSLRADLEHRASTAGLDGAVRFVGFQTDPSLHIRLMDVFVLPVPFGSASIGLLEAMAMQRACIITFGGDLEAVQHGDSGFCARPNDPTSIAEFAGRLLDDDALRASIERAAGDRVRAHYSADRVARQLMDIYDEVQR